VAVFVAVAAAVIGLSLVENHRFIARDVGRITYDGHYMRSANFSVFLETGDRTYLRRYGEPIANSTTFERDRYPRYIAYPPTMYLITNPVFAAFGVSPAVARQGQAIYTLVLLLALLGIGFELGGAYGALGVLALGAASPPLTQVSREYFLDGPQTAFTALTLYLILRSDAYRRRWVAVLVGLALAVTLLFKWSAAFYLAIPMVWFALPNFRTGWRGAAIGAIGLVMVSVMGIGVSRAMQSALTPGGWIDSGLWFRMYATYVLAPALVGGGLCTGLGILWGRGGGDRTAAVRGWGNLALAVALAAVVAAPVYYLGLGDLLVHLGHQTDYVHPGSIGETLAEMAGLISWSYSFAALLIPVGVVFFVVVRRRRFARLMPVVGLAITGAVMVQFGESTYDMQSNHVRVVLTLFVFACVIGGAWVGLAGRVRPVLAGVLLVGSVLTILTWDGKGTLARSFEVATYEPSGHRSLKPLRAPPPELPSRDAMAVVGTQLRLPPADGDMEIKKTGLVFYRVERLPSHALRETAYVDALIRGRMLILGTWTTGYRGALSSAWDVAYTIEARAARMDRVVVFHSEAFHVDEILEVLEERLEGGPFPTRTTQVRSDLYCSFVELR